MECFCEIIWIASSISKRDIMLKKSAADFLKQITSKGLLYSTGNSAQSMWQPGWEGSLGENGGGFFAKSCLTLVTPWTVACQAPLSTGFSRQEYWNGLPCPAPEDLPNPRIEPMSLPSPALAGGFFTTSATWKAWSYVSVCACAHSVCACAHTLSRSVMSGSVQPFGL